MSKKSGQQNKKNDTAQKTDNAQKQSANNNPNQNHNIKKESLGPNTKRWKRNGQYYFFWNSRQNRRHFLFLVFNVIDSFKKGNILLKKKCFMIRSKQNEKGP